jgi:hypothetical protein
VNLWLARTAQLLCKKMLRQVLSTQLHLPPCVENIAPLPLSILITFQYWFQKDLFSPSSRDLLETSNSCIVIKGVGASDLALNLANLCQI